MTTADTTTPGPTPVDYLETARARIARAQDDINAARTAADTAPRARAIATALTKLDEARMWVTEAERYQPGGIY